MAELNFAQVQDHILYALYCLGRDEGHITLDPGSRIEFSVPGAGRLWCERAFEQLGADILVEQKKEPFTNKSRISITTFGIRKVEQLLANGKSTIAHLLNAFEVRAGIVARSGEGGPVFLVSLVGNEAGPPVEVIDGGTHAHANKTEIPASDRTVTLDHNSASYSQGISNLEKLTEDVRSTNEYSGPPEDKERAVAELSAVRRLLSATRVRVAAIFAIATPVLAWVATNVLSETTKELAKKLADWLFKIAS